MPEEVEPQPAGLPPGEAIALARELWLSARIAARHGRVRLAAELAAEDAAEFHQDRMAALAAELGWLGQARQLASVAAELGVGVVFLKFMALCLTGRLAEGSRRASDLDVLVAPAEATKLEAALRDRGLAPLSGSAYEHHLPALAAPLGGAIEIHTKVLGLRLGRRGASAELVDLAQRGLLERVHELPGACYVPVPAVLTAHALVHGLAQHGFAPHSYPMLRLLADLADLDFGLDRPLPEEIRAALLRDLPLGELQAAAALVSQLVEGDLAPLGESPHASGEAALLHHLLAGALDPDYRASLRLRMLWHPLSDRGAVRAVAGSLSRALFPSTEELASIYGSSEGRVPSAARRLLRPFDLTRRAARYARSFVRVARRREPEE